MKKEKMRKKIVTLLVGMLTGILLVTGCGMESENVQPEITENSATDEIAQTEDLDNDIEENDMSQTIEDISVAGDDEKEIEVDDVMLRVGSLKGPTTMGIVKLMSDNGSGKNNYEFTMEPAADTILGLMVQGNLDIALVPANVAAVLYKKTEGGIKVIDINTLGVLYMVSGQQDISDIADIKGKTIYLTGKGTTPDFVLQYLLGQNGIAANDVQLEYKSEPTEVVAMLAENPDAVGLLPQPFVTVACMQNEQITVTLDLTEQWNALQGENGSKLVTGVTIVNADFLEEHPGNVKAFMEEHKMSAAYANDDVSATANLVAEYGIIEKAPVAEKALPKCNITYIDGADMKAALSGYLQVLYDQDPTAVGGAMPDDNFYYIAE